MGGEGEEIKMTDREKARAYQKWLTLMRERPEAERVSFQEFFAALPCQEADPEIEEEKREARRREREERDEQIRQRKRKLAQTPVVWIDERSDALKASQEAQRPIKLEQRREHKERVEQNRQRGLAQAKARDNPVDREKSRGTWEYVVKRWEQILRDPRTTENQSKSIYKAIADFKEFISLQRFIYFGKQDSED